jgi:hypothetical protein
MTLSQTPSVRVSAAVIARGGGGTCPYSTRSSAFIVGWRLQT